MIPLLTLDEMLDLVIKDAIDLRVKNIDDSKTLHARIIKAVQSKNSNSSSSVVSIGERHSEYFEGLNEYIDMNIKELTNRYMDLPERDQMLLNLGSVNLEIED